MSNVPLAATGQPRRHKIRGTDGKFTPAASPHHGAVQSSYDAAEVNRTQGFTPNQDAALTPQERKQK